MIALLAQTDEAIPMDTEAQMKEVAASLKEEGNEGSKEAPSSSGQDDVMVRQNCHFPLDPRPYPFASAYFESSSSLFSTGGAQRECRLAPAVAGYGLLKEQASKPGSAILNNHVSLWGTIRMQPMVSVMTSQSYQSVEKSVLTLCTASCRSMRALHFTGTDNIEQAVGWIVEHEEDPDLDTPLLIPQVSIPTSNHVPLTCNTVNASKSNKGLGYPSWMY